jgi:hypothetical protein
MSRRLMHREVRKRVKAIPKKETNLPSQAKGRSQTVLVVGFQITAGQYREIVEAAETDEQTVSSWIREVLMKAVRRADQARRRR